MDNRVLVLTVPSALVLAALVFHSLKALPRRRAIAFWISVTFYGVARGGALRLVTEKGLKASFPYVIHNPLFPVLGVSLQEVAGWAIVAYLGWWLGWRFSRTLGMPSARAQERPQAVSAAPTLAATRMPSARAQERPPRLFPQVLWACLFLGAISWAVESAAQAAGWWHWTLPARSRLLINVPFIGLVDWFFVGIDFLLPFTVFTSGATRRSRAWMLTAGLFPLHFASHTMTDRLSEALPIPFFHLVHWVLTGGLVWLAMRSTVEDPAFEAEDRGSAWIPAACAGAVLADAALVEALWVGRPDLLPSTIPAVATLLCSLAPFWGLVAVPAGVALAFWQPPLVLSAVPGAAAWVLRWASMEAKSGTRGRRAARARAGSDAAAGAGAGAGRTRRWPGSRWRAPIVLAVMGAVALGVHYKGASRQKELTRELEAALALRDRGDLEGAVRALTRVCDEFPDAHAARALLGEILYRTNRLEEARSAFSAAVEIKRDFLMGHRYLAVIELRKGDKVAALARAKAGLETHPGDLELLYVQARASGGTAREVWDRAIGAGPRALEGIASLAYEVGDAAGASEGLDLGLRRWPDHRPLYAARVRVALSQNDVESARRVTAAWRERFPEDAQAMDFASRLELPGS